MKTISTVETLFDDASTRKKYTVMEKIEIMADDERNEDIESFWEALDDFLEWGTSVQDNH